MQNYTYEQLMSEADNWSYARVLANGTEVVWKLISYNTCIWIANDYFWESLIWFPRQMRLKIKPFTRFHILMYDNSSSINQLQIISGEEEYRAKIKRMKADEKVNAEMEVILTRKWEKKTSKEFTLENTRLYYPTWLSTAWLSTVGTN